ncbi:MAG: OPT/YSL family transporter [Phycisphaerales bacterium]|nr:MAG: OPT/YSL family transporter [Phycisphaerales bacterium]
MAEREGDGERIIRTGAYPELTLTAVIVGYLLGIVITISWGYACLILGFSHESSELAAILGFGILRGILGRTSIVENNINQTIASAVNSASAGMMFSIPALFILGETAFNPVLMVFGCIAGGILGIAFIIPLRKQMIDFERLTYPGGVAVATVLKSPGAGIRKAQLLLFGAATSGLIHFGVQLLSILQKEKIIEFATGPVDFEHVNIGAWLGMPEYMNGIWYVSLMTVGVGFLCGRGGIYFVVGGFACYWVLAPILAGMGRLPTAETMTAFGDTLPEYLRLKLFRPVGIGMLIGGALAGILLALPLIISAVRSMQNAAKMKSSLSEDEMPIRLLYIGIAGATVLLFVVAITSVREMGIFRGALMALLGTLWIWVAGVILSECIGRTNWSPMSGMTLIAVTILIVIASGIGTKAAKIASVMVGAATCVAMAQATDLMLDLKTGYLVGATPRKQQMGQFMATWLGPVVIMVLIFVLHKAYGLGSKELPAAQATALAETMDAILGGKVPLDKYAAGAGLGALLSASGIGGLGILVGLGFYLPFHIVLTYSIGTVIRLLVDWKKGLRFSEEVGLPIAAGLIVGEALVGVGFAFYKVVVGFAGT